MGDKNEAHRNAAIRALAIRMAQKIDVHVDRAERAIRNLLARGLIEIGPAEGGQ